jgi:hypothetical protein
MTFSHFNLIMGWTLDFLISLPIFSTHQNLLVVTINYISLDSPYQDDSNGV